jgi:hypothetical protein
VKKFITATFVAALAMTQNVNAGESFTLFERGHWTVSIADLGDSGLWCNARVSNVEEGISFAVWANETKVDAVIFDEAVNTDVSIDTTIGVWVDRQRPWLLEGNYLGSSLFTSVKGDGASDFMAELMYGNEIWIDTNLDESWDYMFSLYGSKAAMIALADCTEKL